IVEGVPDARPPLRYPDRASGLMSVVRETGRAIRTDNYEAECARLGVEAIRTSADLGHWLGVPMAAGDRVLGVLALRGGERPFTERDERLLTNLAHLAALALRSARLFEERTRAYRELAAAQDQLVRTETRRAPGDPVELREALTNLILNAVDAMPDGGVLTLTTAVVDGAVVVTVGDTGVGISPTIRDRIFDPFFTTKGPQGTGLGLSMTYAILERHGARITVDSEEGRGTTFRLTFVPAWELEEPPTEPAAPPTAGEVSLRCLVVDDEPTVGAMLGDVLE